MPLWTHSKRQQRTRSGEEDNGVYDKLSMYRPTTSKKVPQQGGGTRYMSTYSCKEEEPKRHRGTHQSYAGLFAKV